MIELPSANADDILFETRLLDESDETRGAARVGNRVTCGVPRAHDLTSVYSVKDQKLPTEIQLQLKKYEFWLLRLVCTLHEADHSHVRWMKYMLDFAYETEVPAGVRILNAVTKSTAADSADDPPIAYDLFPLDLSDAVEATQTRAITANFSFGDIGVDLGKAELALKYEKQFPRITGFGKGEPSIYWQFKPGLGQAVTEGVKEMDVIVRKRRGMVVRGIIQIDGRGRQWGVFSQRLESGDEVFYF